MAEGFRQSEFEGWSAFEALRWWLGYEGADRLLRVEYSLDDRPSGTPDIDGDGVDLGDGDLIER
jgi:hypothetical protein